MLYRGLSTLMALTFFATLSCDGGEFIAGQNDGGGGGKKDSSQKPPVKWDGGGYHDDYGFEPGKKDAGCGGQRMPIQLVQKGDIPDLHLVVDRSGSMIMPVDFFNLTLGSKWDAMKKTLGALVSTYKTNIRFGLTLFPNGNQCGPGKIDVPLQMGNFAAVQGALTKTGPTGSTPTHTSLDAVRAYLKTVPPGKGKRYVLLATDGMPNCGTTPKTTTEKETLAAVKALAAAGIKTFVVGFGDIVAGNPKLLNDMAIAGGVPNATGPHKFYAATSATQLQQAFFNIAGGIIPPPCTYKLNTRPKDPSLVNVTFNGKPVPRNLSNKSGWNYSAGGAEITFYGPFCDMLRTGKIKEVRFIFGCKGPVIK